MGIINTATQVFKDSVRLNLDWKKNANSVGSLFSSKRTAAAVALDVDEQEFIQRYRNVRFSSMSALLFMAVSFITVPTAHTMMGMLTSLLAAILFFLFYFRYAFLMWVCRDRWSQGTDLELTVTKSVANYLRAIVDNPAELMPLALPGKGTSK